MSNAALELETASVDDEFGLDDFIEAEENNERLEQEQAEQQSNDEVERAKALAEKMNTGFLFGVNKLVCPSVENIDDIVDREQGVEALTPLANEMGGTMPPWLADFMQKYDPYIKAGMYMGMTVYTASQCEKQVQATNAASQSDDDTSGDRGQDGTE